MIVLDTSILSLAFRRRRRGPAREEEPVPVRALRSLILEDAPLGVPGLVLQELLSGVHDRDQFRRLERLLAAFPLLLARRETHLEAARISNACRAAGVAASAADCLIAAHAQEMSGWLFTMDQDFVRMAAHCGLVLYRPTATG